MENEDLMLVDENDKEIGTMKKEDCHRGDGRLHRAFSIFVFNDKAELLIQQRGSKKKTWPLIYQDRAGRVLPLL